MDKKTVFEKTKGSEIEAQGDSAVLFGDVKRIFMLVDDESTVAEITKRAPPSLRATLQDVLQKLVDGGYIRDVLAPVEVPKKSELKFATPAFKMAVPPPPPPPPQPVPPPRPPISSTAAQTQAEASTNTPIPSRSMPDVTMPVMPSSEVKKVEPEKIDVEGGVDFSFLTSSSSQGQVQAKADNQNALDEAEAKARAESQANAKINQEATVEAAKNKAYEDAKVKEQNEVAARKQIEAEQEALRARSQSEMLKSRVEADVRMRIEVEDEIKQEAEAKRLQTEQEAVKKSAVPVREKIKPPSILANEPPSVLYSINLAVKRLCVLLENINKFPDAREKIIEIVTIIHFAVKLNEDLALASIQLNHASGDYSVRHCVDTAILAIMVAETMNKDEQEIQDIAAAALTMNISMLQLQEKLQKSKEVISAADKIAIYNHPIASIGILYEAGIEDSGWLLYVLQHHEHEDGTGYPVGNTKSEIDQNAKILSLADKFCARISARDYRVSVLPSIALRDIFIENGAHTDATLAAYFIKVLGLYPPGTLVQLKNNEVAVISQRGTKNSPCIASSLVKPNGELYVNPVKRDTTVEPYTIVEAIFPAKASVRVNPQQIWGALAKT